MVMVVLVGGLVWLGYAFADFTLEGTIGLSGLVLVVALLFLASSFKNPARNLGLVTLRERPTAVVWVYPHVSTQHGHAISASVMLGLASGRRVGLPVEVGREGEVLEAVAQVVPHAHVGFSPELDRQFRRDPQALRTSR